MVSTKSMKACLIKTFNNKAIVDIIDDTAGAQFADIVYDDKVKQSGATWRIRWIFITTCSSTAFT